MAKANKTGRDPSEHGTFILRRLMTEPAWCAMTPKAQVLYFWLKLEWKGRQYNNNGKIRLSLRQAAQRIGIGLNTAGAAFHELQAKGFIVVKTMGALGVEGEARGPSYELTELAMPGSERPVGRTLYKDWRPGHDYPVAMHNANNPNGRNGRKIPSSKARRSHPQNRDVSEIPVINSMKAHHEICDVRAESTGATIIKMKTSLITMPHSQKSPPNLNVMAGLDLCPLLAGARG